MKNIEETSKKRIDHLQTFLKTGKNIITRYVFWKIHHNDISIEDLNLKVGRYTVNEAGAESLECDKPKSELTLKHDELMELLRFLHENYEPFRQGFKRYILLDGSFDQEDEKYIRSLLSNADKRKVMNFILENELLPEDVLDVATLKLRRTAVQQLREMMEQDLEESSWQRWFQKNAWVLGSEFVQIIDDRRIDPTHTADFLMKAHDGFLDVVEIKRAKTDDDFWCKTQDHGNQIPTSSLVKAIMQSSKYLFELEKRANDIDFCKRVSGVRTVKPRCILIFGRSNAWTDEQREACRLLNAGYHNITIMTYDHVLERAERIIGQAQSQIDESLPIKVEEPLF